MWGGLHPDEGRLSPHLASRKEVGDILLECPVLTIVPQAGVVIGSGSVSFEMVRHLTEVLPYMPAPRRARMHIQPVAVAGLPRRRIAALPVLTPGLASHWVGLITPVPRRLARPLAAPARRDASLGRRGWNSGSSPLRRDPSTGNAPWSSPRGLTGRLYWLSMLPFHGLVFSGMVSRIVAIAERRGPQ